jgi:hypothetical protein
VTPSSFRDGSSLVSTCRPSISNNSSAGPLKLAFPLAGIKELLREQPICFDNFRNCAYLHDPDRNVIRTDGDVRKPTEKDQVNTQVSA